MVVDGVRAIEIAAHNVYDAVWFKAGCSRKRIGFPIQ